MLRTTMAVLAVVLALGTGLAVAEADVTYSYTGKVFTTATPPYTLTDRITGSFTVPSALSCPGGDITGQVTAYSFSDGVHTLTNATPFIQVGRFAVFLDCSGNITSWHIGFGAQNIGAIDTLWCPSCGVAADVGTDYADGGPPFPTGSNSCGGTCVASPSYGSWSPAPALSGSIFVDGVGQAGKSVRLKQGTTTLTTTTTASDGSFRFDPVPSGTYKVIIMKVMGSDSFFGHVWVEGTGAPGLPVKIGQGGGSTTTANDGSFYQPGVPAGSHKVTIKKITVP